MTVAPREPCAHSVSYSFSKCAGCAIECFAGQHFAANHVQVHTPTYGSAAIPCWVQGNLKRGSLAARQPYRVSCSRITNSCSSTGPGQQLR